MTYISIMNIENVTIPYETMEFRTFWFGKYKGKEICGIIASHTGYILWLLENTQFKLTKFEQEFYDVVALARAYGEANYVYPKKNLIKFIKNKNQDTPFYVGSEFFGTKKEYDNNIFVKVYSERYCHNAEYDLFAYKPPRKDKIWDTMAAIHKSAFEYLDTEEDSGFEDIAYGIIS